MNTSHKAATAIVVGCKPVRGTARQLLLPWLTPNLVVSRSTSKRPGGRERLVFQADRFDFAKFRVPTPQLIAARSWQPALLVTIEKCDVSEGVVFAAVLPIFVSPTIDLSQPELADAIVMILCSRSEIVTGLEVTADELASTLKGLAVKSDVS